MPDMTYSDEYREASADAYQFVIQKILDEAVTYEGFTLTPYMDKVTEELLDLTLDWTDSTGKKHYRTLWEKRDG